MSSREISLPASGPIDAGDACVIDRGSIRRFDPDVDSMPHGVARGAPANHLGQQYVTIVRAGRLCLAADRYTVGELYADRNGATVATKTADRSIGVAIDSKTLDVATPEARLRLTHAFNPTR